MRFDGLHQVGEDVLHLTIDAIWLAQEDIEVRRWADGTLIETIRLTSDQFEDYRSLFAPHLSRIRSYGRVLYA